MIDFLALATMCAPAVHISTMAAVVQQESRGNPWAIGINKAPPLSRQPTSQADAVATARKLVAAGLNIDVGLGQINIANFKWLGLTLETAFDPCTNLRASQRVLVDCYHRASKVEPAGQRALHAALSCYNTGNFRRGFANGYVQKVVAHAGVTVPGVRKATGARSTTPSQPAASNHAGATTAPASSGAADVFATNAASDPMKQNAGTRDAFATHPASDPLNSRQALQDAPSQSDQR